jgi:hypothetical protein
MAEMARQTRLKRDIPFATDAQIAELVEKFEACTWPYERWTHRAHLAVATHYLTRLPFEEALARIRNNIQQYNRTCGDPDGYHETITVFFMRFVQRHLHDQSGAIALADIVEELFRNYGMGCLLTYYSAERLWSADARTRWLEPDVRPLGW